MPDLRNDLLVVPEGAELRWYYPKTDEAFPIQVGDSLLPAWPERNPTIQMKTNGKWTTHTNWLSIVQHQKKRGMTIPPSDDTIRMRHEEYRMEFAMYTRASNTLPPILIKLMDITQENKDRFYDWLEGEQDDAVANKLKPGFKRASVEDCLRAKENVKNGLNVAGKPVTVSTIDRMLQNVTIDDPLDMFEEESDDEEFDLNQLVQQGAQRAANRRQAEKPSGRVDVASERVEVPLAVEEMAERVDAPSDVEEMAERVEVPLAVEEMAERVDAPSDVEEMAERVEVPLAVEEHAYESSDDEFAKPGAAYSDSSRMYASSETESEADTMWPSEKLSTDELGWASATSGSADNSLYASSSDADDLMSLTKSM